MAASSEESFKVCGLCSQLVDESVEVTAAMRAFLCSFLALQESRLPAKICLECYQRATDCRNFKDRCDRAIHKLNKSAVYTSMILGGTPNEINAASNRTPKQEKKLLEAERKTNFLLEGAQVTPVRDASPLPAATPAATPAASSPAAPRGRPGRKSQLVPRALSPEPEEVPSPAPRATRSGRADPLAAEPPVEASPSRGRRGRPAAASKPKQSQPRTDRHKKPENARVVISQADKDAAEALLNPVQNGLATAEPPAPLPGRGRPAAAKRKASPAAAPPAERRASPASRAAAPAVTEAVIPEPSPPAAKSARKTGSGRVVKETKRSGFVSLDSFTEVTLSDSDDSDAAPLSRKAPPKPAAATPKPKPASVRAKPTPPPSTAKPKPTPPAAKKAPAAAVKPKPEPAAAAVAPPAPVISDDEGEDMEEIFPAVGPYQCEICQKITDTKQQFVDHIKDYHINVVDEEVLNSLESDLRKNKKKAERAKRAAAAGGAIANGSLSSSPKKPHSPTKNRPPEELSASMQRRRAAPIEDRTCKLCDTVLSSPLKADHARHQKTYKCIAAAKAKGLSPGGSSNTLVNAKAIKEEVASGGGTGGRNWKKEMVSSRTPVVLENAEMDHLPTSTTDIVNPKMEPSSAARGSLLDPFGTESNSAESTTAGGSNGATTSYFDALSTALATAGIDPLQDVNSSAGPGFIG